MQIHINRIGRYRSTCAFVRVWAPRRKYGIKPSRANSQYRGARYEFAATISGYFHFRDRCLSSGDIICNWINKSDLYAERRCAPFHRPFMQKIMPHRVKIAWLLMYAWFLDSVCARIVSTAWEWEEVLYLKKIRDTNSERCCRIVFTKLQLLGSLKIRRGFVNSRPVYFIFDTVLPVKKAYQLGLAKVLISSSITLHCLNFDKLLSLQAGWIATIIIIFL